MILQLTLVLALVFAPVAQAAVDAFEFKTPDHEARFHALTAELRCPKCQNQNIADSDSPIAEDLRREVYRIVDQGGSDAEVMDFMVTRYGEFVLYRPQVNAQTWALWYGPYVLLGLGALVILVIVAVKKRQQDRRVSKGISTQLSSEEQAQLDQLLNKENRS